MTPHLKGMLENVLIVIFMKLKYTNESQSIALGEMNNFFFKGGFEQCEQIKYEGIQYKKY